MAKKGKKKDPEKKFALQAAKEAKQNKKAQKRLQKESRREAAAAGNANDEKDPDLDTLLDAYQKQSLDLTTPIIEVLGDDPGGGSDINMSSSPFPYPPRGNFSFTLAPTSNDIYMFGGEYYNGVENLVFDELLCWSPDSKSQRTEDEDKKRKTHGVWKRIISPQPRPPARCSHSSVFYNNALYIFGGELASADNYHHYRDLWKFDLKTNLWTEIKPRNKGGPSSRSGHRALVWRHYMIIFGGFHEAVREAPRWFNDLFAYDFSTNSWMECSYSKLATIPPERSAFNFGIVNGSDAAFLSGGYSKLRNPASNSSGKKTEGLIHTDCWALHLKGLESGKTPTWERISRKGEYPSQRSGTGCAIWKNKMLIYGGVQDEEFENHRVKSVFYDDLFAFDMDRKRWFRLNLKKKAGEKRRRRKGHDNDTTVVHQEATDEDSDGDEGIEGEAISSGWGVDKLRSNMFAFIDGDGNIVYERIEEEEEGEEENNKEDVNKEAARTEITDLESGYEADSGEKESSDIKREMMNDDDQPLPSSLGTEILQKIEAPGPAVTMPFIEKSEVMTMREDGLPEAVSRQTPLPRIKTQVVVRGNTMIVYGGILEVGDREVTLDDIWSIELNKREEWVCIYEGSMHKQVWRGVTSDDEKSYISTDPGTGGNESDDEDDFDDFDDVIEDELDLEAEEGAKAARKAEKKLAKKEAKRGMREEIKTLNEKLDSSDPDGTPKAGEDLADFYSRTSEYWGVQALKAADSADTNANDTREMSVKELKREGFNLARTRYEQLKSALDRLYELEMTQKENDDKKQRKKATKKEKKKDRRR